jgi:pyruvate/2-oxoglutarate/acetoin dehydrogenase E1 component
METIAASVKKTGRVVGVTEAYRVNSFISELAARIQEELFDWLDAPIVRVTGADAPVPMSESLETRWCPPWRRHCRHSQGAISGSME